MQAHHEASPKGNNIPKASPVVVVDPSNPVKIDEKISVKPKKKQDDYGQQLTKEEQEKQVAPHLRKPLWQLEKERAEREDTCSCSGIICCIPSGNNTNHKSAAQYRKEGKQAIADCGKVVDVLGCVLGGILKLVTLKHCRK